MLKQRSRKILIDMLSLPTAPFCEDFVRQYIFEFCSRREHATIREDHAGNILVRYKHPSARLSRPVCLCAHMDHPGFRALRMIDDGLLKAQWHGGVPPEYFTNAPVRFFSEGVWVHGRVKKTRLKTAAASRPQVDTAEIQLRRSGGQAIQRGAPGMWDLPDPQIKGTRVHARACDDIAGCAGMLACLDSVARSRARTEAYFLFTRAEEVGFIGAIAACEHRTLPKKCLVVAIETSTVLPGVQMGGGPILRVGDKSSVFSPDLTAWCQQVADALAAQDRAFTYQRKLMDGGSCESSAYCQYGYDATGICMALGNYHNCDRDKRVLAPEFISLDDLENMIRWFVALTAHKTRATYGKPPLRRRLNQLKRRYQRLLSDTA